MMHTASISGGRISEAEPAVPKGSLISNFGNVAGDKMTYRSNLLGMVIAIAFGLVSQLQPSHAAPPTRSTPAAFDWTAYYLSLNAGGGWRNRFDPPSNAYYSGLGIIGYDNGPPLSKTSGFTGGVGFGYNVQLNNSRVVVGIDYEFQWAALADRPKYVPRYFTRATGVSSGTSGTTTYDIYGNPISTTPGTPGSIIYTGYSALNYDSTDGDSNRWTGIFRGRIGYAFDRLLIFGTGGAAYRFSYDYGDPSVASTSGVVTYYPNINHRNAWGWVAGGGVEYAVTDNLFLKVDYLHMDFGGSTYVDPIASTAVGAPVLFHSNRTADLVRAGLNLKIDIPAIMGLYGNRY
jgi:outer membrane immunogenic protein